MDLFDVVVFCDFYRTGQVGSVGPPQKGTRRGEEPEAIRENCSRDSGGAKYLSVGS